jgi:hypothetical protein
MAKVENVKAVIAALRRRASEWLGESSRAAAGATGPVSVAVGYTQSYAIYVHENLQAKHPVGQAKYLEQPFRELAPDLAKQIEADMRRGTGLAMALLRAGLLVQRESQLLVPVDTGALRASAFTLLEKGPAAGGDAA